MEKHLGIILTSFIAILIGVIMLITLADQNSKLSITSSIVNDSFTGSNTSCTRVTNGCIQTITAVYNGTNTVPDTNYTLCRSNGNRDGLLMSTSYNTISLNTTYVSSEDCTYVDNSTARALTSVIIILVSIGVLAGGLYWLKGADIFDKF